MRDLTIADVERLASRADEARADEVAFQMDEDTFRAFYERTARPVWMYLSRMTGDPQAADDLLQDTYYRFLRADRGYENDMHRKNYLFLIATNLVRDARRRTKLDLVRVPDEDAPDVLRADGDVAASAERRTDLTRAMARLKPRELELLWLAYAQGSSHQEIAESLGVRTGSIKQMLFRARRRLAGLLRSRT